MTWMPGASHRGPLPALTPAQVELRDRLRADVLALGGERNTAKPGTLEKSAAFVESAFRDAGYEPRRLPYDDEGVKVDNLEAQIAGSDEVVVVGAHYDSAPGATGADDNGSGVAAMLALARTFAATHPKRTLRFVAFVNEEPPYFWTPKMGSVVYAKACKDRGDRIVAMLSLETLGYFRDEPRTQKYPPIVSWLYPDRGDFIGFVGNAGSRSLVRSAIGTFRANAAFPSEGAALPSFVMGVGWSDHWSFYERGWQAIMVTDTAPFRNPHYHLASDKPETLDYDRLARVTSGLEAVVRALVD
jgi:Zn-dependent M28 family amino/carboxypeptidase